VICRTTEGQRKFLKSLRDACVNSLVEHGVITDRNQLTSFLDRRLDGYIQMLGKLEGLANDRSAWFEAIIKNTASRFELHARGVNPDGDGTDDTYTKADAMLVGALRTTCQTLWISLYEATRELATVFSGRQTG